MMASDAAREQSPLLRLPVELRLQIYDQVMRSDMHCPIITDIHHVCDSGGTRATLIPKPAANLPSHVSWLNLQKTCRTIASEMHSHMREASHLKVDAHGTYVLDMEVDAQPGQRATRTVTWRQLPCHPVQAHTVVINVIVRSGSGPWTQGGPASLARAIYQLLNHILHLGPLTFRRTLLPSHLSLRDLYVNVDIGVHTSPAVSGCFDDPLINWRNFINGWTQISRTGFLSGFVETTRFKREGADEVEILTEWQRLPALPGYWRGLGFQWGVECAGYWTL